MITITVLHWHRTDISPPNVPLPERPCWSPKQQLQQEFAAFFFFTTTGKPTVNGLKTLQIGAWQDGCVGFEKTQHVRLQGEQTLKASSFHCEMRASEPRITTDNQEVKRRNRNQSEPWNFRVMDTDGRTFEQRSKITPSKKTLSAPSWVLPPIPFLSKLRSPFQTNPTDKSEVWLSGFHARREAEGISRTEGRRLKHTGAHAQLRSEARGWATCAADGPDVSWRRQTGRGRRRLDRLRRECWRGGSRHTSRRWST